MACSLDRRGTGHVRGEPARDAGRQLGGGVAVEGDHPDPVGGHAPAEEHAEPSDEGRRLAAAGRGDDLGRPIGQCGGRALLGIERREQAVSRCCGGQWRDRHRSMMANAAYWAINDALPRERDQCVFFEPGPEHRDVTRRVQRHLRC